MFFKPPTAQELYTAPDSPSQPPHRYPCPTPAPAPCDSTQAKYARGFLVLTAHSPVCYTAPHSQVKHWHGFCIDPARIVPVDRGGRVVVYSLLPTIRGTGLEYSTGQVIKSSRLYKKYIGIGHFQSWHTPCIHMQI